MTRDRFVSLPLAIAVVAVTCLPASSYPAVNVTTYHNDNARSGQNLEETILTPANVNVATFGKLFTHPVDGQIYAQPLYVSNVSIPGKGVHNAVFVVTQRNSVYAFDADSKDGAAAAPLWHVSFVDSGAGITTVPAKDVRTNDIAPEIGITGTPAIDLGTGTMYLVAKTKGPGRKYVQRLHALDIATGAEKFGGPVEIQASIRGSGVGNNGRGDVIFNPLQQFNRAGLALSNGIVYVTYTAHGDKGEYHGWVLGYDARSLKQVRLFNATPNGKYAGIWMSGAAPAIDSGGNLYVITANGTFDPNPNRSNFGNSFLKLKPDGKNLTVADYFTPHNQSVLDETDMDLSGGGVLLLPEPKGGSSNRRLLIGCGKGSTLYVLDRDKLGGYNRANDDQIVQSLPGAVGPCFAKAAVFKDRIYLQPAGDPIKAFAILDGKISATPVSQSSTPSSFMGGTPSISANGADDGIVWVFRTNASGATDSVVLHAFDAGDLSKELYNSTQAGPCDLAGPAVKFTLPTVANGKVYVGTANALTVYGSLGSERGEGSECRRALSPPAAVPR